MENKDEVYHQATLHLPTIGSLRKWNAQSKQEDFLSDYTDADCDDSVSDITEGDVVLEVRRIDSSTQSTQASEDEK